MDGETLVNDLVELRSEVNDILQDADYYPFLFPALLSILPSWIEASELRAWLFKVYTVYKDKNVYEAINKWTRNIHNFLQTTMNSESLDLRVSVYRNYKKWYNTLRSLR